MGDGGVDGAVEPYNYAPYMGLSTQFKFPLGEVGLTIDRCSREGDIPWKSRFQ